MTLQEKVQMSSYMQCNNLHEFFKYIVPKSKDNSLKVEATDLGASREKKIYVTVLLAEINFH